MDKRRPPVKFQREQTITEPFTLYVVSEGGASMKCFPVFKEVVANDRPDLLMVDLSCFSIDTLSNRQAVIKDYKIGDLLIVYGLQRRWSVKAEDYKKDFNNILSPAEHRYWAISKFAVVEREVTRTEPVSLLHESWVTKEDGSRLAVVNTMQRLIALTSAEMANFPGERAAA